VTDELSGFDPQSIYDEAARDYEDASRDYWQYIPLRTVERLGLSAGERVLDVPCGSGPAVLAAAERVGPSGAVVGIDYAAQMVAITREKVRAAGFDNVELSVADMTTLDPSTVGSFDGIVCSLGLFFVDDMPALLRSFSGLLRPGGRMGVAVFGELVLDPLRQVFYEAVGELAPDAEVLQPWRRTENLSVLEKVFDDAGISDVAITTEDDRLPLRSPGDWWRVVMGSGFRRTVVALDEKVVSELRRRCDAYIAEQGISEIVNRTHYAVASA
jgi:ubiquinone/menaquinone biosynthesis C-methylase UbiE